MRVKSIVIDGFKSYAHRKELADLSPHFNAITGLNGSGKSNIFDAICFVMGITNLKKVRAEDPRELIFRAGTTGVHAARVTIEFVNDDPATAPPGYSCEDYPIITVGRQIKLGGKQQFFFNNTVSMQSKVKRFFESISLNVDNPHFMVLQGTVHKLIGMRSQDILSLIEEAVGTKAFDHRRRTAETLIRNKEKKIEEIDTNIQTQIGPMLEAMRADQEEYRRLQQLSEGLEARRRFRVAFEYHTKSGELDAVQLALESKKDDVAAAKEQLRDVPQQEDELTRRSIRLQDSLGAPSEAANALREQEDDLKKQQSRQQTQLATCQRQLKQLEQTLRKLQQDKEKQSKGQQAFQTRRDGHEALVQSLRDARDRVAKLKQAIQLVQSGVQAGASGVSLAEERATIERDLLHQGTLLRRCEENIVELTAQLQRLQKQRAQQTNQLEALEAELEAASVTHERVALKYAPLEAKEKRKTVLEGEIAEAKRAHHAAYETFQRESHAGARSFDVDYDRRACAAGIEKKVFGRVGELVMPKEDRFATALMVGAQQQILRVVVETDAVAEDIIKHGLRQRTAFMALNKLFQPRRVEPGKVQEAQRIAKSMGESVYVARELAQVKDSAFNDLADFVYAGFFVCTSLRLAQELAYNPAIKTKAVTLDGEVAEPNGLMSGGSMNQLRDVFGELKAYQSRKAPITATQQRIDVLEREYDALRRELEQHAGTIRAFKAAEEGLDLIKQRLQIVQGNAKSAMGEVEAQLHQQKEARHAAETQAEALAARRAQIDAQGAVDPDSARKELQKQLVEAERQLATLSKEEAQSTAEFERLEADTEQQALDLANKQREAEEELAQQQSEKANVMAQLEETKRVLGDVQERLQRVEEQRQRLEKDIEETQEELSRISEKKMNLDNVVKNAEVDMREWQRQLEELRRFVREEERRHNWLAEARDQFGPADGPFYFADAARTATTLQELREAEAQSAVMSKRMNKKASVLYEDRKKEFDELVSQRAALGEDKEAIQACILGIEDKKWSALDRMVTIVSRLFGKLFSTCLPGATAELSEERNEHQHLCGLGVRVCFNGKEKQSLSELSGGQRSLLALCLILAILRVRPAPIYILDEVDAALDPSHTQNIGRMLQVYFPKSQFLLVSLKDGMFNNANVLYQVRNTQGYSEVFRMENKIDMRPQAQQPAALVS